MSECGDRTCTLGVCACEGCNGYGVLTMGGRKYRKRGNGKNIGSTAQPHAACHGTGLVACGCQPLDAATLVEITRPLSASAEVVWWRRTIDGTTTRVLERAS